MENISTFVQTLLQDYLAATITTCIVVVIGLVALLRSSKPFPHSSEASDSTSDPSKKSDKKPAPSSVKTKVLNNVFFKLIAVLNPLKPQPASVPDHPLFYKRLKGFKGQTVASFSPDEESRYLAIMAGAAFLLSFSFFISFRLVSL